MTEGRCPNCGEYVRDLASCCEPDLFYEGFKTAIEALGHDLDEFPEGCAERARERYDEKRRSIL